MPYDGSLRVAVLGFGTVGRAFERFLRDPASRTDLPCRIAAVADHSGGAFIDAPEQLGEVSSLKSRGTALADVPGLRVVARIEDFIRRLPADGVRVLVEALPTDVVSGGPAVDYILSALDAGLGVVTVNKGPVIHSMDRILAAAQCRGVGVAWTGTTGVRPPPLPPDREIQEIEGVLNGTTNFILTRMLEGSSSYADALLEAQELGIAEPDPSLDLDGWDTACKILILARTCMGAAGTIRDVDRAGLSSETEELVGWARERNSVVRLVGRARRRQGTVRLSVAPRVIGPESPLFGVSGTSKLALFRTRGFGTYPVAATSGREAIARVIMDDVIRVSRPDLW